MVKFNKRLSQLESIYQVAKPVVKEAEPLMISDFIHHILENQDKFGVEGWTEDSLLEYVEKEKNGSVAFIDGLLKKNGHLISQKSITEGIEHFKNG